MGWRPESLGGPEFVIVSTAGGLRAADGSPIALGYHTGHWEISLLVREAAETLRSNGAIPFAGYCSDPCDGRSMGTTGMFDSLPYRNDAAIVMRRLIRSLPTAKGVMGIATCDKGLPATMLALAGCRSLPGLVVPGGVTLPTVGAEDAAQVQSLGARFAHDLVSSTTPRRWDVGPADRPAAAASSSARRRRRRSWRRGWGSRFRTARWRRPGEPSWYELGRRSATRAAATARARHSARAHSHAARDRERDARARGVRRIDESAAAHSGDRARRGAAPPTVDDWIRVNRATPRLVDALPNGPKGHPTVQVFMAGGVPEVMLHLRSLGLLNDDVITATGDTLDTTLDWWAASERRTRARARSRRRRERVARRRDHESRRGATRRSHEHRGVPGRQPRAERIGDQSDGDRCVGRRRRSGVSAIADRRASSPTNAKRSRR